ncbi:MAG TPA: aspartate aminotransferase family protein [Terriglobia bacterium]|nr:aspartate aminotransferase family protein [Terriglobia bacterium]
MTDQTAHTPTVLGEHACQLIPGGVTSSARQFQPAIIFREAQGAILTDSDGNRYLDYHLAFGPILLGHNHPAVNARVVQALQSAPLSGAGVTELEIELAHKIHQHVPCAEKVLLCTSGSEAVSSAIHVARAVTGRPKIIKFRGSYHGTYDSVLCDGRDPEGNVAQAPGKREEISQSLGARASRPLFEPSLEDRMAGETPALPGALSQFGPAWAGMPPGVTEGTLTCTYNDLDEVERAFARHPEQVAAVLVEPIGHSLGCVLPKPGFLEGLRQLTSAHGAVLIFDEVITGFRHHLGGYQAICGVTPDLATFGKAMANGFPMAAICGRAEIMDRFSARPGGDTYFAGTYHGHPAGCAAALATIEVLEREPVHEHIFRLGDRLRKGLTEIHQRLGTSATVAGFGSIFITYFAEGPIENHRDAPRNDASKFVEYHRRLIERGIFLMPVNLKRGHISYAHTDADIDRMLDATERALLAMPTLGEVRRVQARQSSNEDVVQR